MKHSTKHEESGVRLFELFSVEELESRLEFKRKRKNPRGVSSVNLAPRTRGLFSSCTFGGGFPSVNF